MIYIAALAILAIFLERVNPRTKEINSFSDFEANLFWFLANIVALPYVISELSLQFRLFDLPTFPFWLQVTLGLLALDLMSFCWHFCFHRFSLLWQFHKVHHSIEYMNAFSSFRHSWVEGFILIVSSIIVSTTLNLSLEATMVINYCSRFACFFQHSNLKLPWLRKWDRWIISPDNHYLHHSTELIHKYGQNFGFIFSLWDRLCGSYASPLKYEVAEIGLRPQDKLPKSPWLQFFHPFSTLSVRRFKAIASKASEGKPCN